MLQPCASTSDYAAYTLVSRVVDVVHMLCGRIQCIDVAITGRIDGELLLCLLLMDVILQTHEAAIEIGCALCPHQ